MGVTKVAFAPFCSLRFPYETSRCAVGWISLECSSISSQMKFKSSLPNAVFSQFWTVFNVNKIFPTQTASFCQKSSVLFHPNAEERKINMFRSIIRFKVYFETRVKYICKKACTGIGALRTVWDTTRLGYMMTSNKFSKWCPRRGKKRRSLPGSSLRLEVPFSHSTLRAVT